MEVCRVYLTKPELHLVGWVTWDGCQLHAARSCPAGLGHCLMRVNGSVTPAANGPGSVSHSKPLLGRGCTFIPDLDLAFPYGAQ